MSAIREVTVFGGFEVDRHETCKRNCENVRGTPLELKYCSTDGVASKPFGLLSESDAASFLGIGRTKLRTLGLKRKILGGRKLYPVSDLKEYVDLLPYEGEEAENVDTGWEDVA